MLDLFDLIRWSITIGIANYLILLAMEFHSVEDRAWRRVLIEKHIKSYITQYLERREIV